MEDDESVYDFIRDHVSYDAASDMFIDYLHADTFLSMEMFVKETRYDVWLRFKAYKAIKGGKK